MRSFLVKGILYGLGFYIALLVIVVGLLAIGIEISTAIRRIVFWQFSLIDVITGPHPILGYDYRGEPIYEGTPADLFVNLFGLGIGFLIYPLIFVGILGLRNRFRTTS